ncbi:MAG TPA: alpha/beta hydrolase, partial [Verrucomicrobiae bacterium]|nr:alpha/beta hydrolase [Verrucomicrobiae bacterium]
MPYILHDGLNFNYSDTGSGTPFIFQHGLGADLTQPVALADVGKKFRVISFDFRAHGGTHPIGPIEKIGLAPFADDLGAVLDLLSVECAIIGGISMGAAVSLNFALRFPDRVLGLILSRPAWLDAPNPWNVKIFTLITRLIAAHGPTKGQYLFKETLEYQQTLRDWPEVAHSLAGQFERPGIEETAFKLERIIHDTPSLDRREWSRIKVPTLVLGNKQDPIHPFEYAAQTADLIPGAELKEIT